MERLNSEEIAYYAGILSMSESDVLKLHPFAVRLLACDAQMSQLHPDYQPLMTPEQILTIFPGQEK